MTSPTPTTDSQVEPEEMPLLECVVHPWLRLGYAAGYRRIGAWWDT